MYVLKWAWRHGALTVDEFDTLDDAVSASLYAADYGEEAIHSIEVFHDDGRHEVHDKPAVIALWKPLEQAQEAERKQKPPALYAVRVKAVNGEWSTFGGYVDRESAAAEEERLLEHLAPHRVQVEALATASR